MLAILILATVLMASLASAWAGPLPSVRSAAPDAAPALTLPDTASPAPAHAPAMHFLQAPRGEAIGRPPTLWTPPSELHYRPDADQLTHFDPTNLKVFGGAVGGNGVKNGTGAVVSLTWPLQR
jgi:hypothetical protein